MGSWKHNCIATVLLLPQRPGGRRLRARRKGVRKAVERGQENKFGGRKKRVSGWNQPVARVGKTGFLLVDGVENTARARVLPADGFRG